MTKKCKSCQSDIDVKTKKCPHCQTDQRNWIARHPVLTGLLVLLVIGVIGAAGSSSSNSAKSVSAQSDATSTTKSQPAATTKPAAMQVLLDLQGSGTKSTQKFTAASDWDLTWSYDCSGFGSKGNFMVEVYNGDGSMSIENQGVNQLGMKDSGVEHYHKGGTFYLSINSECSWTVQARG
jgi:hypothetical protein